MSKLVQASSIVLGACLLQACSAPAVFQQLTFQPAQQVRHSANAVAASYYEVGRYHHQRGDLDLALSAYTYAIARDPRHPDAKIAAATIHATQGRLDQAKAMLLDVITTYPNLASAHTNLGYVYYLQGDYPRAIAALRYAVSIDGDNHLARNNLELAEREAAKRITALPAPSFEANAAVAHDSMLLLPQSDSGRSLIAALLSMPDVAQPSAARATTPDADTRTARLEVANGNGVTGMAARMRKALSIKGIVVSRLTNARPYLQVETTIEYRAGHKQDAVQLQDALRGHAVLVAAPNLPTKTDLRLVLGKDASARLAWINSVDSAPPYAALALAVPQPEFPL